MIDHEMIFTVPCLVRHGNNIILFTTDVSARGVDYPDVTLVLQVGFVGKEQYLDRSLFLLSESKAVNSTLQILQVRAYGQGTEDGKRATVVVSLRGESHHQKEAQRHLY